MNRIFDDITNPNNAILSIPQEQGGTEDDNYLASIGDAVMKHIDSLSDGERHLWETVFTMPDGAIFRTEPSPTWHDPDPFALRGKDMEIYFEKIRRDNKGRFIPKENFAYLKEAMEIEIERQAKSEDVFDNSELIPFEQMERFPGMTKHIDIPSTPRDRMIYMGATKEMFYDEFPTGHPREKTIRQALSILNQEHATIDKQYTKWFDIWLSEQNLPTYVEYLLSNLSHDIDQLDDMAIDNPSDLACVCLEKIDTIWRKEYINGTRAKLKKDPIAVILLQNKKEWKERFDSGESVYSSIKKFGQTLFLLFQGKTEKVNGEERHQLRRHHWQLYKEIKNYCAAKILVNGIELNHSSPRVLEKQFGQKNKDNIFFNRPFDSILDLEKADLLHSDVFTNDVKSKHIIDIIEQLVNETKMGEDLGSFRTFETKLFSLHNEGAVLDWSAIWMYYRTSRELIIRHQERRRRIKEQQNNIIELVNERQG